MDRKLIADYIASQSNKVVDKFDIIHNKITDHHNTILKLKLTIKIKHLRKNQNTRYRNNNNIMEIIKAITRDQQNI